MLLILRLQTTHACLPNKTGATRKAIILIQAQDYFAGYSNYEYKLDFQGTITITQDAD